MARRGNSRNAGVVSPRAEATASAPVRPVPASPTSRTTVVLPTALDQNLEVCALRMGVPKNDVIKRAVTEFLVSAGLRPEMTPRTIEVTY